MIRRVASALMVGSFLTCGASAQESSPAPRKAADPQIPANTPAQLRAQASLEKSEPPPLFAPIPIDPAHPNYHAGAHQTIVRHNPVPRRTSYSSNYPYTRSSGSAAQSSHRGFQNPGGAGVYSEYYDENTLRWSTSIRSRSAGSTAGAGPTAPSRSRRSRSGRPGLATSRTASTPMAAPTVPTEQGSATA